MDSAVSPRAAHPRQQASPLAHRPAGRHRARAGNRHNIRHATSSPTPVRARASFCRTRRDETPQSNRGATPASPSSSRARSRRQSTVPAATPLTRYGASSRSAALRERAARSRRTHAASGAKRPRTGASPRSRTTSGNPAASSISALATASFNFSGRTQSRRVKLDARGLGRLRIEMTSEVHERGRFAGGRRRGERGDADREAAAGAAAGELDEAAARQSAAEKTIERGDHRRNRIARRRGRRQVAGARELCAEARQQLEGGGLLREASAFEKLGERQGLRGCGHGECKIGVIKA